MIVSARNQQLWGISVCCRTVDANSQHLQMLSCSIAFDLTKHTLTPGAGE